MSDSFQYKYRPLRQPDAIRLCRILPHSDAASSIHISLSSYHLSNPTLNFTALSYTWGDPSDKTPISVGGSEAFLQVPRSASEALTVLRLHGKKTLFWIDAICIDQNNLQEKTSQVRIMGRIFARAFCTTIYLGPHTKSSQIVFQDVIEAMNLPKVKNPKRQRMVRDRDPPNAAVVQGLEDLIQRPWFQRVWVLQEVYLSQNIWVLCGDTMVPQEMLRDCFFGYSKNNLVTKQNVPFAFRINEPIWGISSRLSWSDLWGCLYWTRGSLATDSRDRLFALRALFAPLEANDTDSFMAEFDKMINYEKSLEEVFETLALTLLRFIGLWLLVGARHEHNRQMPSWVPDWSQNLPLAGDFFVDLGQNELFGRQVNRATYIDYQLLDQRILIVQGWRCGQIQEMGKTYIFADLEDADRQISHLISLITIDQSSETIQRETSNIAEVGLSQGILKVLRQMETTQLLMLLTQNSKSLGELNDIRSNVENLKYTKDALQSCRIALCGPSFIAIAPCSAMEGDILVVIKGAPSPCLLRPLSKGTWSVVSGNCFAACLDSSIPLNEHNAYGDYYCGQETWEILTDNLGEPEVFHLS